MDCFRGRRNQTKDNRQYSSVIRKFALTMHYHSPAGYKFLRKKFNQTLPCTSTFCNWYSQSNLKCMPGILPEAIESLQGIVEKSEGELFVSLSFDEISIRKHVQWIHESKRWSGYITHGQLNDKKRLPIANNILVFMVTLLDQCISIPVAYYAINKLNSDEKMHLLLQVLGELTRTGIKIVNITFDGLAANLSLCVKLGCSFDINNPRPYFINPHDNSKIFILLDPCHMLKLVRSALGDLSYIQDPHLGKIQWSFFEKLERYRVHSKFVTHKFTKRHLQYFRNRMNVRLASQTFSNAVATSLQHLLEMGYEAFQGCEATIDFTKKMDKMFDIMNTKRVNNNRLFKSALNESNAPEVFEFLNEMLTYLKSLKFKTKLCILSRRKTGFLGFLVNIHSIKQMYEELVLSKKFSKIAVFYHSQDPLESFFSRIRALQYANDNPTLKQFMSAMRKLLFFNEITSSDFANCEDSLNILTISSVKKTNDVSQKWENLNIEESIQNENMCGDDVIQELDEQNHEAANIASEVIRELEQFHDISAFNDDIVTLEDASIAFFAGSIELKIEQSFFSCSDCMNVFRENMKIDGHFFENNSTQRPCRSTFIICKTTHTIFDMSKDDPNFDYQSILESINRSLGCEILFPETDFSHSLDHKRHFIHSIIDEYVRLYGTYIAKCLTLAEQQKMLRSARRREVIFSGQ